MRSCLQYGMKYLKNTGEKLNNCRKHEETEATAKIDTKIEYISIAFQCFFINELCQKALNNRVI